MSLGVCVQILGDFGDNAIHVAKYIEVRETQHTQAAIIQVSVTFRILRLAFLGVVLTTINLDDQPRRGAIEINDIVTQRLLTIELESIELFPAKLRPQRNLRIGSLKSADFGSVLLTSCCREAFIDSTTHFSHSKVG